MSQFKENEIRLPCGYLEPLIEHFQITRGALGQVFQNNADAGTEIETAALSWWENLAPGEQRMLQENLRALAAPVLLAGAHVLIFDHTLISTRLVIAGQGDEQRPLLVGEDEQGRTYQIKTIENRDILTSTLLAYLEGGAPLWEYQAGFELVLDDFVVLLAIVDLSRREQYVAMLAHRPVNTGFKVKDIEISLKDSLDMPDLRWILPFFFSVLAKPFAALQEEEIRQAAGRLIAAGLLGEAGPDGTVCLTDTGELLATSFSRRLCQLGLYVIGADGKGNLAGQSALFVRGDRFLWYFDVGGDNGNTVLAATIDLKTAQALLEEIFKPAGVPEILPEDKPAVPAEEAIAAKPLQSFEGASTSDGTVVCVSCGARLKPGTRFCVYCGKPVAMSGSAPKEAETNACCRHCGHQVRQNARFCNSCGKKL